MTGDIRPLPSPPRCRGIHIGDGNYTGCAYGYGDEVPFTGANDCPVCHGSGYENVVTMMAHADFGDPDCCGCLIGVVIDSQRAAITCNECAAEVRAVPAGDLRKTLDEMELGLALAMPVCPFCESVNLFPGFVDMVAFRCQQCHRAVNISQTA
jgi:uncharacterized protein (DUF983 family)